MSEVIGDQIYRGDSNICRAGLHSGVLKRSRVWNEYFQIKRRERQMSYEGRKKNQIESIEGGAGTVGTQAFEVKRVEEDKGGLECRELKEDFTTGLEDQWTVVASRRGSFWQHFFTSGQKAIKYIDLAQPSPIHSPYSYHSFLLRKHHHCLTGTYSFQLHLSTTSLPNHTFGFAFGVIQPQYQLEHQPDTQEQVDNQTYDYIGVQLDVGSGVFKVYSKSWNSFEQLGEVSRDGLDLESPLLFQVKQSLDQIDIIINKQPLITLHRPTLHKGSFAFYTHNIHSLLIKSLHYLPTQ